MQTLQDGVLGPRVACRVVSLPCPDLLFGLGQGGHGTQCAGTQGSRLPNTDRRPIWSDWFLFSIAFFMLTSPFSAEIRESEFKADAQAVAEPEGAVYF